ncbi:MAG TPA: glycoside hydrolase family 2 TIM barrel-domain containing protein [Bacteroidales bacterium]|nr:glycoside hydrolase family 2 TIM barrel-domain containing protein [Bacteroidales bacterium]
MKTTVLFLLMLITIGSFAQNQPYPQLINISGRSTTSLDGNWKIIVDPYENGYYDYRRKPVENSFGKDLDWKDKSVLQEYEFESAKTLKVPGDWNSQMPELYYYEGTVWYRKRFDYNPTEGKRLFLHFGAVNYESIVFLNGKTLGIHTGGFTPFDFEVTGLIKAGENSVVVKVDNKRIPEGVPTLKTDWWNYGGITREVNLIEAPSTLVRDYYVQLKKGDAGKITGWVQLDGNKPVQKVRVEIPELKISTEVTSDNNGYASFDIPASPVLWSPENPKLYTVTIISETDHITDQIGFRTLATKGTKILVNGKETFLRGVCIHEEAAYRNGRAWSADDAIALLTWAKDMGCNFVRLAHYPHNEQMIRQAEKMGIMVWSEVPVYWTIRFDNPGTYSNAEQQLIDMITRDKNRANIIVWSVANETPQGNARYDFLSRLAARARSMDNVRFVSAALEKEEIKPGLMTVNDPLSKLFDVLSFNQYVGWYDGLPEKCDRVEWTFTEEKPVIISEFGGECVYGLRGGKTDRFSEDYQEDLYVHSIAMLKKIPALAGTTPWILKDFRSPNRQLPGYQDDFNRKGLVSDQGQKKRAYFVMKHWYDEIKLKEQSQTPAKSKR